MKKRRRNQYIEELDRLGRIPAVKKSSEKAKSEEMDSGKESLDRKASDGIIIDKNISGENVFGGNVYDKSDSAENFCGMNRSDGSVFDGNAGKFVDEDIPHRIPADDRTHGKSMPNQVAYDEEDENWEEDDVIDVLPYEPDPFEARDTLYDLYAGNVLFSLLSMIIGLFFVSAKGAYILGILLGGAVACGMALHMYRSLDVALELGSDGAVKYMRKRTGVRMIVMGAAVVAACLFPEIIDVLGVVFGLFSLKLSAYLQPVIHIFTTKIFYKGR